MNINFEKENNYTKHKSHFKDSQKVRLSNKEESRVNIDKNRPARAISFGGSAVSMADKFVKSHSINKVVDFVFDNEAAYNAIYSLFIAGMLKPLLVLNSKNSDEKDKQLIATKNFLSAFIGSFMGYTIGGGLIKKSVDVIKNNLKLIKIEDNKLNVVSSDSKEAKTLAENLLIAENTTFKHRIAQAKSKGYDGIKSLVKALGEKIDYKPTETEIQLKANQLVETCKRHKHIFDSNPNFVKEILSEVNPKSGTSLKDAYEVFWKNSTGWLTAIGKAKISSLLLPTVLALIFTKKAAEKHSTLTNSKIYNNEKDNNFRAFNKKQKVSFKGLSPEKYIDNFAGGVEKLSLTPFGERCAKILSNAKKPSPRMGDLESLLLTTYWVQNTSRSKKIAPDQKLGFNIQTVLVTIVSSLAAFTIDWACDKPIEKLKNSYKDILTEDVEEVKSNLTKDISTDELKNLILDKCSNISGSRDILSKLIDTDLSDTAAVEKAIGNLTANYGKKISKFKSLTIFTFVVRFLIPVLMVPIAGKLKVKYKEYKKQKENEKLNKNTGA